MLSKMVQCMEMVNDERDAEGCTEDDFTVRSDLAQATHLAPLKSSSTLDSSIIEPAASANQAPMMRLRGTENYVLHNSEKGHHS